MRLLFPRIKNRQTVENETVGRYVNRKDRHSDDKFKDVRDFLIKLPVESDQCCIQTVQDYTENSKCCTPPGQTGNLVTNGVGKEYEWQQNTYGHLKEEPGPPTGCQISPFVVVGNTDKLDNQVGDQTHAGPFGQTESAAIKTIEKAVVATPGHGLLDDGADHNHHAEPCWESRKRRNESTGKTPSTRGGGPCPARS